MAGRTYTPIQTYYVSSDLSTIEFLNIPQSYTDLVLVASFRGTDYNLGINNWFLRLNSSTSSVYSCTRLYADGSTSSTSRSVPSNKYDFYAPRGYEVCNSVNIVNIMNYSNTSSNKTLLWRTNIPGSNRLTDSTVGLFQSTSAITSINISGACRAGSSFTLYGIAAA